MIYGKYNQAQWNNLTYEEKVHAQNQYRMKIWRSEWKSQAKLERQMGIAGNQLQPYRA
jgi:hypothetical protein